MSETPVDHPKNLVKRAKPVGRALRLIVGAVLLVIVFPWYLQAAPSFLLATLAVLLFLTVFYSLVHLLVTKTLPGVNRWVGALLANVPVILVFILGSGDGLIFGAGEGQLAALTYLGVSLPVTGLRSDAGCEVMAIPGLILGSRTHLACIVFSLIDWLEEKVL